MDIGAPFEDPGEGLNKMPRGRPTNVCHFHDEDDLEHFMRVVFQPTMGTCEIPRGSMPCFGKIPSTITLLTNMGCNWVVKTKWDGEKFALDCGCAGFVVAYDLRFGSFLTFHKLPPCIFPVFIFNYFCCEVMTRCLDHRETIKCIME
jgi:hypothetical protein